MYLETETNNTITIEKSRFICYMKHIESEEEYREYLSQIRKKHYDATHVCSAMICHNIQRSSDDGEPSGTAGAPILNVLQKKGLDETCALVVRYFGGIKLGAGGLIRAYSSAVSECLKKAVLVEDQIYPKYELKLNYETANRIDHFLRTQTILLDTVYDTDVTYIFALKDEKQLENISEYTKGIKPLLIGEEKIRKVVE
ncbi:MAG: YigZ family protein [Oscillospiraceae bacterium]|nr:YigZ family protein [Oscillospiraceae bacterium]MBQ6492744.1 YigZ family protein [Erysipelotrichaceae bacterium]